MGKEHELLEAARTGNLQAVKTILAGKLPRSGASSGGLTSGLRSLLALKPVNINCKDASGETPLHLSALNGHREVVLSLLTSRALLTETDSQGCTPLHLAAWNGHTHICDLLLHHAPDQSIVNAQTNVGETPLHFAAQHGHLDVVSLLLQNKADPTLRTLAERSALDLAAQYGKTGVVRTLVNGRHELLTHVASQPSPLHLAAFNGHLPIVSYLLDSGFPVNTRTDNGTALHEAATSCKLDVIKLLLDRGVDVWAKAKNNMTAEDILRSTQSRLTQEALQIITGHVNSQRTPDSDGEKDINGIPGPGRLGTAREATPPTGGRPIPKPRSMFGNGVETAKLMESKSAPARSSSEPQSPPPPIPPRVSLRPTSVDVPLQHDPTIAPLVDLGPLPTGTEAGPSRSRDASPMSGSREQPKKPPRKTPSMRKTETTTHHQSTAITTHATTSGSAEPSSSPSSSSSTSVYDKPPHRPAHPPPDPPTRHAPGCDATDDAPPLPRVNTDPSQTSELAMGEVQPETVRRVTVPSARESGEGGVEHQGEQQSTEAVTGSVKRESIYANATVIAAEEEIRAGKPHSLHLEGGAPGEDTDTVTSESDSLSHYEQLPTPDYPPPSPDTAVQGIQQRLHPQDKRRSKHMEPTTGSTTKFTTTTTTITTAATTTTTTATTSSAASKWTCKDTRTTGQELSAAAPGVVGGATGGGPSRSPGRFGGQGVVPQGGADPATREKLGSTTTTPSLSSSRGSRSSRSSSSSSSSSSVITPLDAVRGASSTSSMVEVEGEVVEMRSRSVSDWDSEVFAGLLRGSTPGGPRNVVSQICENVVVKKVRSNRRSAPSTIVTFDPLMESREEDGGEVFDADRVLDEIEEMTGSGATSRVKATAACQQGQGRGDTAHHRKSDDVFDDSEEWAKIAATLETFGVGMARESVFVREYEASFTKSLAGGPHSIQSVGEWLDSLSLGQYENTLVANGFDDTDFLGGTIIEDADLAAIGISNEDHRAAIVTAAHRLPPVQPIDQRILPESVEKWLEALRLGQYLDTFISHKYNTMLRVIKLWELELNTVLDITSLGHRKRILASLGDRRLLERDTSMSPARVRRRGSEEDEPRSPFEHIDLYHDYTGVKAQVTDNGDQRSSPRHTPVTATESNQRSPRQFPLTAEENGPGSSEVRRDTEIHIRPPHLMHTTGSIRQWRHRPEVLIKGCCNYTAHYLGSSVVKELKGATSTQEGIAKLKKSTEVISKIPTIMLSISYKGVKFIDAKSKRVICDHEIANIFCACQDGDHMNFFAYVTKDKETSRHYCHVFSVRSREQAGEIILTLGEAFEIAYQMALKERKEEGGAMGVRLERQTSRSDQDDSTPRSSVSTV